MLYKISVQLLKIIIFIFEYKILHAMLKPGGEYFKSLNQFLDKKKPNK